MHKLANTQLSELSFDGFFEDAADCMALVNSSGQILRINNALARLFGYHEEELDGRRASTLFQGLYGSNSRHELPEGEVLGVTKWGEVLALWALILQSQLDRTGERILLLRKRPMKPDHDNSSRIISMASHEFRSPLSRIQLSAGLIERYHDRIDQKKLLDHIGRIKGAVLDMSDTLNDFLSIGRLDAGTVSVHKRSVALYDLIGSILIELSPQLKAGQRVQTRGTDPTDHIMTDPVLLRHCLVNIIGNAVKYSTEQVTISVRALISKHCWRIRISDHGIGIPDADQSRLFEPFFRAGNTGYIEGTGLGLYIVRRYVQLMDGVIYYRSREGKGSCFTLEFPYADEDHRDC